MIDLRKYRLIFILSFIFIVTSFVVIFQITQKHEYYVVSTATDSQTTETPKKYIKWVDFGISLTSLEQALKYDVSSFNSDIHLKWIELLAYTATRNGGKFKDKRSEVMDKFAVRLKNGEKMSDITKDLKYYNYYYEAYSAVLSEFVGEYVCLVDGIETVKYGLKAYSPIAKGYGYSHCDDFGNARNYGFKRVHLGNDLMGSVGSPIIAVEGGTVEALGWNRYGGWRIGIRSFDKKRYYYYAHLRKNHPYSKMLKEGDVVVAGDVIGYLGMTGYSTKENVNNIKTPHLHFGMQLIFDESQKEGNNEVWIDVYNIVRLLKKHRMSVIKDDESKDYFRVE